MQISGDVHAIRIPFKITMSPNMVLDRFVYCYIIYGKEICLVDTGVASSEKIIFQSIEKAGRRPEEISLVIHTHAHPDHMGSTKAIKERTGCKVAVHEMERNWIEDVDLQFKERPVPGFHSIVGGSVKVDVAFENGATFERDCGIEIEAIHTPGHSIGSSSMLLRNEHVMITGDAVPLPSELPIYEDPVASIASLERLSAMQGIDWLLSAWDQPRSGSEVARTLNEGLRFLRKLDRKILDVHQRKPDQTDIDMCKEVLKEMGMVNVPPMPLVIRSFRSNIEAHRSHTEHISE